MTTRAAKEWARIYNHIFALDDPQGIEARAMTGQYAHIVLTGITVRMLTPLHTEAEARRFLAGMLDINLEPTP